MSGQFRHCRGCFELKSLEEFTRDRTKPGGRSKWCRPCKAAKQRVYVRDNWDTVNANNLARRREIQEYVRGEKSKPCADCGQSYPTYVMDFHHVRGEKEFTMATHLARGFSLTKVKAEVAKCDLLCSNCHRIRHAGRQFKRLADAA